MIDQARAYWKIASMFPANKETVYPEHAAVQEFDLHHDQRVLEYGCGGGSDARSYLRRGNLVTACDIVPENVETTRRRTGEEWLGEGRYPPPLRCVLLETSAALPFSAGEFDTVNAHGVIHHIPEPLPVLKEFHRVLKPGGLLYVMLYTESLWQRFMQDRRPVAHSAFGVVYKSDNVHEEFAAFTDGAGAPYARHYTETEGTVLFESAGFNVISARLYNGGDFRTFKAVRP